MFFKKGLTFQLSGSKIQIARIIKILRQTYGQKEMQWKKASLLFYIKKQKSSKWKLLLLCDQLCTNRRRFCYFDYQLLCLLFSFQIQEAFQLISKLTPHQTYSITPFKKISFKKRIIPLYIRIIQKSIVFYIFFHVVDFLYDSGQSPCVPLGQKRDCPQNRFYILQ